MNKKVVYQIYLPSFKDENTDGLGDFKGVQSKLEYIKSLGVEYVWISPFCKSPMKDNGYDVEDFYEINPSYGTKQQLKELINKAKKLGLKMMIDFVFNHTSDKHKWFVNALDGDEKFRKYYHFFKKEEITQKLQEVKSVFGPPIFNETKDGYYFATFSPYQPDLNWNSLELRNELKKIVKYWIDFGFKGIRLDVFNLIDKDAKKIKSISSCWDVAEGKNVNEFWKSVLEYANQNDIYVVAEANAPAEQSLKYTLPNVGAVNSIFTFDHMDWRIYKNANITLKNLFDMIYTKQTLVNNAGGDVAIALDNHDNPRIINSLMQKYSLNRTKASTILNTINLINTSSAYIYQGNEFGLTNPRFASRTQLIDIASVNSKDDEQMVIAYSRDNARSPMPWNKQENLGFSTSKTLWLKNDYAETLEDKESQDILKNTIKLIEIKKMIPYDAQMKIIDVSEMIHYQISTKTMLLHVFINTTNKVKEISSITNICKEIFLNSIKQNTIEEFGVKILIKEKE